MVYTLIQLPHVLLINENNFKNIDSSTDLSLKRALEMDICEEHQRDLTFLCVHCPRLLCKVCYKNKCGTAHKEEVKVVAEVAPCLKWGSYMSGLKRHIEMIKKGSTPQLEEIARQQACVS